jgi:hypothetical protein
MKRPLVFSGLFWGTRLTFSHLEEAKARSVLGKKPGKALPLVY